MTRPYSGRRDERGRKDRTSEKATENEGIVFELGHDFISDSRSTFKKEYPVVYVIGKDYYSILKLYLKRPLTVVVGDLIDLNTKKNDFQLIKRVTSEKIPKGSEFALEDIVNKLIKEQEPKFVEFFNEAKPITTKLHQLKLLPGVGQKRMWTIIDTRKTQPFQNYSDIEERIGIDPIPLISGRIMEELKGKERYPLFTRYKT